jgi:glycerol-1-phosphate dehydrogenase [NAD(P)+]
MNIRYDPADNERFWSEIRRIPGFPDGEEVPLKVMLIESGALFRLPEVTSSVSGKPNGEILAVMDPTPMQRGSDDLKPLVLQVLRNAGWTPKILVLEPDVSGQVHTDMHHIGAVKAQIKPDLPLVSIGSGALTDITKHACYLYEIDTGTHIPYIVYQTANSVSAYTSNMAPVFIDGVKRTLASRYPDALISDLETLRDAPYEMTAAGVGDLLAAFTSFPDWYLAHQLGMDDSYTKLPHALMGELDATILKHAEDIKNRSLPGMAVLSKLIHLGGLSMSLMHATAPLSGYEHIMSHTLDLINEQDGLPLTQHGSQVALAVVLCCSAYQAFLNEFEPAEVRIEQCFPQTEQMKSLILEEFSQVDPSGKAGEECWSDYSIKLENWSKQRERLRDMLARWGTIRRDLIAFCRPPETILHILKEVDAPIRFAELDPPLAESAVKYAFLNSALTRRRLTLGDLLIFFQWDREALWDKIWRWVE